MENINCSRREGNQDNTGGIHSGQATEKCAFNTFLAMALVNDFFLEFFFDIHTKICFSKFCWLYLCLPCTVRFNTLCVSCGGETTSTDSPLGKIGRLKSSHTCPAWTGSPFFMAISALTIYRFTLAIMWNARACNTTNSLPLCSDKPQLLSEPSLSKHL